MADLSLKDKRYLERFLEMESGYVLDFSNRTFRDFFIDAVDLDIEEEKYYVEGGSKANRMRTFWKIGSDYTVGIILGKMAEYWLEQVKLSERSFINVDKKHYEECLKIINRLKTGGPVDNLDAIAPNSDDESFEKLANTIKSYIENNNPDAGIDRLHTFTVKYFRVLCDKYKIQYKENTPLHSLFGGYIKYLEKEDKFESEMSVRILKTSISVMEAFNNVRNNQSFAHDNQLLSYNESLLIFNDIANLLRFIDSIEEGDTSILIEDNEEYDELPF